MQSLTPKRQTSASRSPAAVATPPSKAKTPTSAVAAASAASTATDSPGNWRHPRMDEITKRRAASVFTEANLMTILYNSLALAAVYVARTASWSTYQQLCDCTSFVFFLSLLPLLTL